MDALVPDPDPYWQEDGLLGSIALAGEARRLRLKLRHSEGHFAEGCEDVPCACATVRA